MILAHFKLERAGGINVSPNVHTAAIQRLVREDGEEITHEAATNSWADWPELQDVEVHPGFREEIIEEHPDSGLTYVLEKRR